MVNEYLKKDIERVNKKFSELMHESEIETIEKKIETLENNPSPDTMDEIWLKMYTDVLDLKKNKHIDEKNKDDD
jgi:hypothetical protein